MCIWYSVTDPYAKGNRFRCAFGIVSQIHILRAKGPRFRCAFGIVSQIQMLRGLGSDVHLV